MKELKIEVLKEGSGKKCVKGDNIEVHYTGKLKDGTIFDSSYSRGIPLEFKLGVGQVIEGWDQGVEGMEIGEKRFIDIPSTKAYGETGAGGVIPPNADLEFEVELISINS